MWLRRHLCLPGFSVLGCPSKASLKSLKIKWWLCCENLTWPYRNTWTFHNSAIKLASVMSRVGHGSAVCVEYCMRWSGLSGGRGRQICARKNGRFSFAKIYWRRQSRGFLSLGMSVLGKNLSYNMYTLHRLGQEASASAKSKWSTYFICRAKC